MSTSKNIAYQRQKMFQLSSMLACGAPKLQVVYQNTPLEIDEIIAYEDLRQFQDFPPIEIKIQNIGDAELILTQASFGPNLDHDLILPLHLEPQEASFLTLQYNTDNVEDYLHSVVLEGVETRFSFGIQGSVTPYIQLNQKEFPEVDTALEEEFERQDIVGAAVGIVEGADIVYLRGFGYADKENEIAVNPEEHQFRWASLAKGLVGAIALHEVQKETLSLDDKVKDLLPSYTQPTRYLPNNCTSTSCSVPLPEQSDDISLRMLLAHTAGIQHYDNGTVNPVPPYSSINNPEINTGMSWALDIWKDAPLLAPPGTEHNYSTFGYNLAGVAIEEATGKSLDSLVVESINQLAAAPSIRPDYHWDPAENRAVGYYKNSGTVYVSRDDDVSWKLAGGGFISTPEDLARYCALLLGDQFISNTLRDEELWTIQENASIYGLGFYIGANTVSHTGAQQGTRTALLIEQEENRCYIAMSNSTWAVPFDLLRAAQAVFQ